VHQLSQKKTAQFIRNHHLTNVILITCHDDIIPTVKPDFVFDTRYNALSFINNNNQNNDDNNNNNNEYDKLIKQYHAVRHQKPSLFSLLLEQRFDFIHNEKCMFNRPIVRLYFEPASYKNFYPKFSIHHYMSQKIGVSSRCFMVWASFNISKDNHNKDTNNYVRYFDHRSQLWQQDPSLHLVAFTSYISTPFGSTYGIKFREHRTVVLPQFQGIGIGSRISDSIGELLLQTNSGRFHTKTAHPRYGKYRNDSILWEPTDTNGRKTTRRDWQALNRHEPSKLIGQNLPKRFHSHVYCSSKQMKTKDDLKKYEEYKKKDLLS